ncbi:MAG: hypothetical protein J5I65_06960 [Aridibacter famidurans]|nr:hypothetical protein [Aridibacter famidurans]
MSGNSISRVDARLRMLLVSLMVSSFAVSVHTQDVIPEEFYETYTRSVIDLGYLAENKELTIVDRTIFFDASSFYTESFEYVKHQSKILRLDQTLSRAFSDLPEKEFELGRRFGIQVPYGFIDESKASEIYATRASWQRFFEENPNSAGILQFSCVAFNANHDKSLHYLTFAKGIDWIDAYFVLYSKVDGKWVLSEKVKIVHLRPSEAQ